MIELSTELVALKQCEDHVEVTIKKTVGSKEAEETKSYRRVVGADGGRSKSGVSGRWHSVLIAFCPGHGAQAMRVLFRRNVDGREVDHRRGLHGGFGTRDAGEMHANRCQCLAHADYLIALVYLAR